ncbi:MAG TPA: hypothetical protein ENG95_00930, partial [Nitrospirae bacterium]|nr:hypothetical protein [Nitrospirota bacterium]
MYLTCLNRDWPEARNTGIDFMALNEKEKRTLFVKCKWSSKALDIEVLNGLREKSNA